MDTCCAAADSSPLFIYEILSEAAVDPDECPTSLTSTHCSPVRTCINFSPVTPLTTCIVATQEASVPTASPLVRLPQLRLPLPLVVCQSLAASLQCGCVARMSPQKRSTADSDGPPFHPDEYDGALVVIQDDDSNNCLGGVTEDDAPYPFWSIASFGSGSEVPNFYGTEMLPCWIKLDADDDL